jgi:hypothetical protein
MDDFDIDILLISIGDIDEDDRRELPLGIAFLCGQLKANNIKFKVLDLYNLGNSKGSLNILKEKILLFKPRVIGISTTSYYIDLAKKTIEFIKDISKALNLDIPIVLGGYISIIPDVIKLTSADVICHGEGDITIIELMNYYLKRKEYKDLSEICGITYKNTNQQIITTNPKPLIENLDNLAYPDFSEFNLSVYNNKESLPFYSQRGCVIGCSFCDIIHFYGKKIIRRLSPKRIIEWIQFAKDSYQIKRIDFMDDSFLNNRPFIEDFFELLNHQFNSDSNLPSIKINFQARSNEIIRFQGILKQFKNLINCIEIGTESYSQTQLDRWNKGNTVLDNCHANELLTDLGISYINFYLWLDEKTTIEELDENIEKILELPAVPLMGSTITIPNFVLNYEISAIYDTYGRSSVRGISHLECCEQFFNDTNEYAKKISTIYIGLKKLVEELNASSSLESSSISQAKEISVALFPMAEDILKKRLSMAVDIAETVLKYKLNKNQKAGKLIESKLTDFKEIYEKFMNPIHKIGII